MKNTKLMLVLLFLMTGTLDVSAGAGMKSTEPQTNSESVSETTSSD